MLVLDLDALDLKLLPTNNPHGGLTAPLTDRQVVGLAQQSFTSAGVANQGGRNGNDLELTPFQWCSPADNVVTEKERLWSNSRERSNAKPNGE